MHFRACCDVFFFFSFLIQLAEGKQEELTQKGQNEKKELQLRIEEMEEKEQALQARIEALQADNDFTNERLTALQGTARVQAHTHTHVRATQYFICCYVAGGMSREPCGVCVCRQLFLFGHPSSHPHPTPTPIVVFQSG